MRNNNYTILWWVNGLGIVTLVFANTGTDLGLLLSAITLLILVVVNGILLFNWCRSREAKKRLQKALENPFDFYYEPAIDKREYSKVIHTNQGKQYCESTIQIKVGLHIEFISFKFVGSGVEPVFEKYIDDWRGIQHHNVHFDITKDNIVYMTFDPVRNRPATARIRLGLTYIATEPFDGYIEAELTAMESPYKTKQLRFEVLQDEAKG